jgi:peptide/nickel transport system substrate-binding protein
VIGDGKANFQHNPAEAKKLLAAAGFPNGLSIDFTYIKTGQYGTDYVQQADTLKGMLEATGDLKLRQNNPDYQTEFLPRYSDSRGDFDGMYVAATTVYPDIDGHLFAYYHKAGSSAQIAFKGSGGDEQSYAMIEAQRRELDPDKRTQIVKDWQKYMATKFAVLPFPGQAQQYSLAWPWVGNYGAIRAFGGSEAPAEEYVHWWFDKSKYTG